MILLPTNSLNGSHVYAHRVVIVLYCSPDGPSLRNKANVGLYSQRSCKNTRFFLAAAAVVDRFELIVDESGRIVVVVRCRLQTRYDFCICYWIVDERDDIPAMNRSFVRSFVRL
jgi:hypothetical protein